jgi:carbon starvation protein
LIASVAAADARWRREVTGARAWLAIMLFIWIALIYVIVAFTDITASTFVSGGDDLVGGELAFNPGGAVAAASVLYLLLAVVMGVVERVVKPPLWLLTVICNGDPRRRGSERRSDVAILDGKLVARDSRLLLRHRSSVWALLQPRGYLGGSKRYSPCSPASSAVLRGFEIKQEFTLHAAGPTGALFPPLS